MVLSVILLSGASVTASLFVIHVAVLPLLFKYNKTVRRKIVFSNCINYPRNLDYENPKSCNIVGRYLDIEFCSVVDDCHIKLGAWHIVPCSIASTITQTSEGDVIDEKILHEELKRTKRPVVLYCHGNSNHRGSPHRLQMYRVLQHLDFHIITFDYRGYGDSTNVKPTEAGVVEDTLHMYCCIRETLRKDRDEPLVLLWGHSLGSSIAANLLSNFEQLSRGLGKPNLKPPDGVILESPFNNFLEEIRMHPFSKLVSWLPHYESSFLRPLSNTPAVFATDAYMRGVRDVPVLILHTRGDRIVPYELAVKLHETITESRKMQDAPVQFHTFERGRGLGHNNICEADDLPHIVTNFMSTLIKYNRGEKPVIEEVIQSVANNFKAIEAY